MRNKKFFAVTGAALLLLAGCRTIPQNPEQMTCSDLQYLAEESIDKLGLPFFWPLKLNIPAIGVLLPVINGLKKAAVFASVTTNAITFRWKCWRSAEQPWNKRLIVSAFPSHNAKTLIKNEWPLLSTKI